MSPDEGREVGLCTIGRQQLGRAQPLDFRFERRDTAQLHDAEAAGGQVQPGQTEAAAGSVDAGEQVVAPLLQQGFVGERTRRDDAHHLAFHGALDLARLAALLADRDRLALADQFGQVGIEGDRGHAGHRDGRAGGGAALRERNIQQLRRAARVVVEHFIEIAHAVEQQHVGVLGFDAQVLLHHGGVGAGISIVH